MMSDYLCDRIRFVADYVGSECDDWVRIKREILVNIVNEERDAFSRRHPLTKKHSVSEFDECVMGYWKELTGTELKPSPDQLHSQDWVHKPRGWALQPINEERKRAREQQCLS